MHQKVDVRSQIDAGSLLVECVSGILFVWLTAADATWANRLEGSSTSGHVIMAVHPNILNGEASTVSLLAWNLRKIRRVARSFLGVECAAFPTGLKQTDMFRVLYGEMREDRCDLPEYEKYLQATEALCVHDCKSLTDALLFAGSAASKTPRVLDSNSA